MVFGTMLALLPPCKLLDNSIAQTIHLYPFNSSSQSNYIALQAWPYEHQDAVSGFIHGGADLTLTGTFPAGSQIVLYIRGLHTENSDNTLSWTLDGNAGGSYVLEGFVNGVDECNRLDDDGNGIITAFFGYDGYENGYMPTIPIDSDTSKISFFVGETPMYVDV